MEKINTIKKKIESTEEMRSIVKTMKVLSAVNIRQYAEAVEALREYDRSLEIALGAILREMEPAGKFPKVEKEAGVRRRAGAVIFGSERGLSGRFNDQVVSYALSSLEKIRTDESPEIMVVGEQASSRVTNNGSRVDRIIPFPDSKESLVPAIDEIVISIDSWRSEKGVSHISIYYNHLVSGAAFSSRTRKLLPLDLEWLEELRAREWPAKTVPMFTMNPEKVFSALIRRYFYAVFYRSFMNSLAAENASRLAAMQAAEKNIDEKMDDLEAGYNHQRQSSITSELLDIISGFETISKEG